MRQTKVYLVRYIVGGASRTFGRNLQNMKAGELKCKANSIVHVTRILTNLVGHSEYKIVELLVQENGTWRLIDG